MRDEDDIDRHEDSTARQGEPRTPNGFVNQLVPEREIKVNAHHDLCSHHNRYSHQTITIFLANDVLENVHITHHTKEGKEREDDEILHRHRIVFLAVPVLRLREDDGFVSITEGLGNHRHNHRHFHTGTILTQLRFGISLIAHQREDDLIGCLVENTSHTQHQDGPRVTEHPLQQGKIKLPFHLEEVGDEEERDKTCTPKIDAEDIEDLCLA